MNNYKNEKNLEIECQKAYEILKEALKNKKLNDTNIVQKKNFSEIVNMFELMDLNMNNCKSEKAIELLNTIINKLKKSNEEKQTEIKGLVQECNELYTENQEMIIAINDKDNQIHDLRNHVDNLKHDNVNYRTRIHELGTNSHDLIEKIEELNRTIALKNNEIKELKDYNNLSIEKRHTSNKYNDSKIKQLEQKIHTLNQELIHERNYKEILIQKIDECFKGCTEQFVFLDLHRKNSLYYLEELKKLTTSVKIKEIVT